MANLPAVLARDFCADNPFLIVTVEVGLVNGVVISIPDSKLRKATSISSLS
jgi:hypothetical protein